MMACRVAPLSLLALLAACGAPAPQEAAQPQPAPIATPALPMAAGLSRQGIEAATFEAQASPPPASAAPSTPAAPAASPTAAIPQHPAGRDAAPATPAPSAPLIRAQILLDRSPFSPGAIDGLDGENLRQAVAAFEAAHDLTVDGQLDAEVFGRLATDSRPVLTDYVITPQDLAGPYIGTLPEDLEGKAKLPALGYATLKEALAERFHMTEALFDALNPGVDLTRAGQTVVVPAVATTPLAEVARIEVDKTSSRVTAFDRSGGIVAVYPATIGSSDRPAPTGNLRVMGVANAPDYTYDPSRVTYGDGKQKLVIAAGPNNPVGVVWIDLSRDTYGIHGTPDPELIGKTASNGCVRLTNWDALQLAAAVKPGVEVIFRS